MNQDFTTPPQPMKRKHSTQIISMLVGALLTIIGLSGILFSGFAGLHISIYYSTIITISGGILFYNGGFKNNSRYAFMCCLIFSIFYGLHAIAGWVFGQPGIPQVGFSAPDPLLIKIIPRIHELGKSDHVLNTLLSLVLMGGAIDWWKHHSHRRTVPESVKYHFNKLIHH